MYLTEKTYFHFLRENHVKSQNAQDNFFKDYFFSTKVTLLIIFAKFEHFLVKLFSFVIQFFYFFFNMGKLLLFCYCVMYMADLFQTKTIDM
jgi:hypothetical protein